MNKYKCILVIDSNRSLMLAEERVLKNQKYQVYTASNGAEGLHKAKKLKPDAILLDIFMPGLDGYQVGRTLKEDDETSDIPIIFLCGEDETREKNNGVSAGLREINLAFECGASDYLLKPVDPDDLVRSVKNALWFTEISLHGREPVYDTDAKVM